MRDLLDGQFVTRARIERVQPDSDALFDRHGLGSWLVDEVQPVQTKKAETAVDGPNVRSIAVLRKLGFPQREPVPGVFGIPRTFEPLLS